MEFKKSIVETDQIGKNFRIGVFCHIGKEVKIGDDVFVGDLTTIRPGAIIGNRTKIGAHNQIEGICTIGDDTRFHSGVHLTPGAKVGNRVFFGPGVVSVNTLHPLCPKANECIKGPIIEDDVKVGGNATIIPGITIGKGSLIAAGAVVIKDVPPFSVIVGNPGKNVKDVRSLTCTYGIIDGPYVHLEE